MFTKRRAPAPIAAALGTAWLLCAPLADAQVLPVRISFKRVSGTPLGTVGPLAPDPAWAGAAGTARIQQMVTDASSILAAAGLALPGCTSAVSSPSGVPVRLSLAYNAATDLVDLVDPAYPFSFFDVILGPNPPVGAPPTVAWKDAMEAACEANPARYAFRSDAINVYLVDTITDSTSAFGGYCSSPIGVLGTTFMDEDDIIFIAGQPTSSFPNVAIEAAYYAASLAHEIGHYFGLAHTFETVTVSGGLGGAEPAPSICSGCSSSTLGDLVDDTPADPWNPTTPATQSVANLLAVYGACATNATQLRGNVMAQYYLVDSAVSVAGMSFSVGQRLRMSNYLAGRGKVLVATPPPTITSVLPALVDYSGQNSTLLVQGCNLPSSASGLVDVTLGLIDCSAPGPTCGPEFSGANTLLLIDTAPSATCPIPASNDLVVVYNGPIPPGRHTVSVRNNQDVVASLGNALEVTPYLDLTIANPVSETFQLLVRTASANQPYMLALEAAGSAPYGPASPPPFPLPGVSVPSFSYLLYTNFANPTFLIGDPATGVMLSTDATGTSTISFSTAGYASGVRFFCQGVELTPNGISGLYQLTNLVELAIP